MPLDLFAAVCAEPARGVALEEPGHDAARFGGHVGGEGERVGEDALVHCVYVLVVEGGEAGLFVGVDKLRGLERGGTNHHFV